MIPIFARADQHQGPEWWGSEGDSHQMLPSGGGRIQQLWIHGTVQHDRLVGAIFTKCRFTGQFNMTGWGLIQQVWFHGTAQHDRLGPYSTTMNSWYSSMWQVGAFLSICEFMGQFNMTDWCHIHQVLIHGTVQHDRLGSYSTTVNSRDSSTWQAGALFNNFEFTWQFNMTGWGHI